MHMQQILYDKEQIQTTDFENELENYLTNLYYKPLSEKYTRVLYTSTRLYGYINPALSQRQLSSYQDTYGRTDGHDSANEIQSINITLPDNHIIAETTQKKNFKDPRKFFNSRIQKSIPIRPYNNLQYNENERKILQVRTENSEYHETISKLGHKIMKEQFYGPPRPIKTSKKYNERPSSAKSICSDILMNSSNNHILSKII
ncbi:PREDICTED: uncharacterized protein LOC105362686 [Ceratosolen solmsi marchali]|uniref:Uncharacterized protein LOC105362686 n=1 Tax=Ceratosolen solmsi marchali TaxID=326594 RepID=A0AAJ6YI40_9HYME|nr:PREDICTED: uncharacterized protein LOC105362686 [Ceratosolen solmsi marchali]